MFGIEIKSKWGFRNPLYAIANKDNTPTVITGTITEIIVRQSLFGNLGIFYTVQEIYGGHLTDNLYDVKEDYIAMNPDCLEEMIENGEYNED